MLFVKYWKSILMTLVILVLSFAKLPSIETLPRDIAWDKIAHFLMYLLLTILLIYDFHKGSNPQNSNRMFLIICMLFPVLLGAVTELFQSLFFHSRVAEWYDLLSNTVGVFTGWGIFLIFKRNFKT